MKLAHIINVTQIDASKEASYLHVAQPATLRSMLDARQQTGDVVSVELIAIKHKSESVEIPEDFVWAPDIETYAWEHIERLRGKNPLRPLPRIGDIIHGLYETSHAEYFIYTNLDIGLRPHFYRFVAEQIEYGIDGMSINRRNVPKEVNATLIGPDHLRLLDFVVGDSHPGSDCFVFRRDTVPSMRFGNVYIGYPPIGRVMYKQVQSTARRFVEFKDARVTYHLGSDQPWKGRSLLGKENARQARGLCVSTVHRRLGKELKDTAFREWFRKRPGGSHVISQSGPRLTGPDPGRRRSEWGRFRVCGP